MDIYIHAGDTKASLLGAGDDPTDIVRKGYFQFVDGSLVVAVCKGFFQGTYNRFGLITQIAKEWIKISILG